jgi:hypothetical protein
MLEKRLVAAVRDIIRSSDADDGAALANAIQQARTLVENPPAYDTDQAVLDNFLTALADLGFGDEDTPVNGGDCVDYICEYWDRLAPLASEWPLPPELAQVRTRLNVGTRVLSVEGETSDTDQGEQATGPHAIGTITGIDDTVEHGICVAFEPSGVSVLLSCAELADDLKYEIDPEAYYPSREAVVEAVERMLAHEGNYELAVRVVANMIEQGQVEHTEHGYMIERDTNVFEIAADLSREDLPDSYPPELAISDRHLTADQLFTKYSTKRDNGEHPQYLRRDWRHDVAEDNTLLGYWQWVEHQLEQDRD